MSTMDAKGKKKDVKDSNYGGGGGGCFNLGACFGFSSRKSKHNRKIKQVPPPIKLLSDHGNGELVKNGNKIYSLAKTFPITNSSTFKSPETTIKEIHVVHSDESDEAAPLLLPDQTTDKKEDTLITRKGIRKPEIAAQETCENKAVKPLPAGLPRHKIKRGAAAAAVKGRDGEEGAGGFDSIVGAAILGLTLAVMLIWGKMFAIVCAAAWLYFIHRLRKKDGSSSSKPKDSMQIDLDSKEYKKKVVLQGFLERV